jgi:hypothetical protein
MTGLYPIIRRARRPLIIGDDDAGPAPAPPPVLPVVPEGGLNYGKAAQQSRRSKNAKSATNERKP